MSGPLANESAIDPESVQKSLLRLILQVSAALGVLAYLPSVYVLVKQRALGVVAMDTIALLAVFGLLSFDRLPFRGRAVTLCLIYYLLGVGLLVTVGSISQIYLFGFSIIVVLLLGVRMGLCSALLSSVSLLAVGALGRAGPDMVIPHWKHNFTEWVVITINFTLVCTLLTLAVGAVLGALNEALGVEIRSRISLSQNIADRKQAEAERDRLLAQLQLQIERMPLAYLLCDEHWLYTRWNPAAERIFGFAEAEVLGKHPFETIVPKESQPVVRSIFDKIRAGSMDAHGESENVTKDGTVLTCEWHNTPLFDGNGAFLGLLSLAQDVTGRKRLEGQLRQSQKMEAVGQLAGGIAHDFNNLLSVVLTYSDFVLADLQKGDSERRDVEEMRRDVEEIRRAGMRAAGLTRQLLMFSRQQVVEPKILDLNLVLSGVDKMLRRLVGEDIEFTSVFGASLGRVRADPGSIDQVIMNLAVNARDAMPVGGKLTMETANVVLDEEYAKTHLGAKPGPHVMLSVTDTGTGMDTQTLARIFEPFFTTKEQGKGTGLGLSTVFGIVEQSGGTVWVYSEPTMGTTFKVYLPRVDGDADHSHPKPAPATLRGSETILLVEDDEQVRDVALGILQRHGYTVLDARNAEEACAWCERHEGRIHLLLTDVVMPKMSGPALAKTLLIARPEMKVLCMSGYTDDAAFRHGVIDAKFAYLQKPITVETLTTKVRAVLDSIESAAGAPQSPGQAPD